jgi:hypothetical protein
MSQATIQDVNSAIMFGNFTNDQLDSIISAIKFRRSEISKSVKRSISKGATVNFYSSKRGTSITGIVEKVAVKYVTVREDKPGSFTSMLWRVPANMLTVAE